MSCFRRQQSATRLCYTIPMMQGLHKITGAAVIFILAQFPFAAHAGQCDIAREAIMQLRPAEYPASAVWDSIYGAQDMQERFVGGTVLESERMLAVGERFGGKDATAELIIADIDTYGRVVQEQTHKIPGLRGVNRMASVKGGFIATGRIRTAKEKARAWFGFFDATGKILKSKEIGDKKFALEPQDIIPMNKNSGFLAAVAAEESAGTHHAVIYKMDSMGNAVLHRAFAPGLDNKIISLSPAGPDHYMATGYIRGDDGRRNGWLVMFNKNAEIVWQRQYPRGRAAQFNRSVDYDRDNMIVVGESVPAGGGNRAGWAMMINRVSGDIIWQRYYTGQLEYSARDVMVSGKDGLFSILLDSNTSEKEEDKDVMPSIRLLTLDPRGNALFSDDFMNAEGVHAYELVLGPNEHRLILGGTNMAYRPKAPEPPPPILPKDEKSGPIMSPINSFQNPVEVKPVEEAKPVVPEILRSMDGWAIAATAVPPYKDPCKAPPSPVLN